jgi:hypothetical protein
LFEKKLLINKMYQKHQMQKKNNFAKTIRNVMCALVTIVVFVYGYFSFHVLSSISKSDTGGGGVVDDINDAKNNNFEVDLQVHESDHEPNEMQRSLRALPESSVDEISISSGIDAAGDTPIADAATAVASKPPKKGTDPTPFLTMEGVHDYYTKHLSPVNDVVTHWPPENPDARPADWVDVVPAFDWNDPQARQAAQNVREAEYPFKVINVPGAAKAKKKWTYDYLAKKMGSKKGNVEVSETKSFMYWKKQGNSRSGPTTYERMSWPAFLKEAKKLDEHNDPNKKHFYWHTSANSDKWIEQDLDHFKNEKDNFFIVDPSEYTVPIACRVGTKGLCNENHYDTHRTFATQIFGSKRWIFQPPQDCMNMYLYPDRHISARHSAVDINSGNINFTKWPKAKKALAIDTVVEAGDIAYLPSNWFHHIISLEFNMQCIARSGHSLVGDDYIEECGFAGGRRSMGQGRPKKKRQLE